MGPKRATVGHQPFAEFERADGVDKSPCYVTIWVTHERDPWLPAGERMDGVNHKRQEPAPRDRGRKPQRAVRCCDGEKDPITVGCASSRRVPRGLLASQI